MKSNEKIAVIIPAYNEESNIANVLKILLQVKRINEVIVVDDGSVDKTAEISQKLGVKVIKMALNQGKGEAMRMGVKATNAEIIVFFDADLVGLTAEHVLKLIQPIIKEESVISIGIIERGKWRKRIARFFIKIDPLFVIAGQRALRRFVFENIPTRFIQGFMIETALNFYCKVNKLKIRYFKLKGMDIIVKEKKWGLIKGVSSRLKMFWQLFKIRVLIWIYKKEFILKKSP